MRRKPHRFLVFCLSMSVVGMVSLFLLEVALRLAIYWQVPAVRNPGIYYSRSQDGYFQLTHLWAKGDRFGLPPESRVHPRLGWCQKEISPTNPLGLFEPEAVYSNTARRIWFLGDSFVTGIPHDLSFSIPNYLDDRTPEIRVCDLSVGAYGPDQMALLLEELLKEGKAKPELILLGILTEDLERSSLSLFTGYKPYFVLKPGGLRLRGVPVPAKQDRHFEQHLPTISYAVAALRQQSTRLLLEDYGPPELLRLNRAILQRIFAKCESEGIPVVIVLFHTEWDLLQQRQDWRSVFTKPRARPACPCWIPALPSGNTYHKAVARRPTSTLKEMVITTAWVTGSSVTSYSKRYLNGATKLGRCR